ncbi:hypothetical protein HSR121_0140 [Halapricum desulfuricans]|uniref:Uncharacterized protein n=1 Tax=Halapricum desulfuricans TaxID=2841257 RepID=A0A897MW59_9EURY|nr:hypothetical protein HSR121_0140 [Halapricum desulfuricans]
MAKPRLVVSTRDLVDTAGRLTVLCFSLQRASHLERNQKRRYGLSETGPDRLV